MIIAAPTTTIARPAIPPESRYGNCAGKKLLLAAPFQPKKIARKPTRHSSTPSCPPSRPMLFCIVVLLWSDSSGPLSLVRFLDSEICLAQVDLSDLLAHSGVHKGALFHDQRPVREGQGTCVLFDHENRGAVGLDPRVTSQTVLANVGLSPSDASSMSSSRGRDIRARPTASICCSQTKSVPATWSSRSASRG